MKEKRIEAPSIRLFLFLVGDEKAMSGIRRDTHRSLLRALIRIQSIQTSSEADLKADLSFGKAPWLEGELLDKLFKDTDWPI